VDSKQRRSSSHDSLMFMFTRPPTLRLCGSPLHRGFLLVRVANYGLYRAVKLNPTRTCLRDISSQRPLWYPDSLKPPSEPRGKPTIRENIYTLPNLLTISRIIACPVLGWSILESNFFLATSLLLYAGFTDLVCSPCVFGFWHMNLKYVVL
jgi:hypothetical protein